MMKTALAQQGQDAPAGRLYAAGWNPRTTSSRPPVRAPVGAHGRAPTPNWSAALTYERALANEREDAPAGRLYTVGL